jgi:hypothetical protein
MENENCPDCFEVQECHCVKSYMKKQEQLQNKYNSALKMLQSAQNAYDGSPAATAWLKEAEAKLANVQREIMEQKAN